MVSPAEKGACPAWGMTCPGCKEHQTKKYWRPSQWKHESPVTHWYTQCKVCDGEMPQRPASNSSSTSSWTAAAPPQPDGGISAAAYVLPPSPEVADHVPVEALELIELMTGFDTERASRFVGAWMELPYKVRKAWSHSGAVRCRDATDPVHYHCPIDGATYFDPGNWLYACTLSLMCPELMPHVNWNCETKGDICEAIMGLQYDTDHGLVPGATGDSPEFPHLQKDSGITSAIVDAYAWYVWRLCVKVGADKMLVWIEWTVDMVRYREHQARADASSMAELRLDTLAEYHGPKEKIGHLTSGPPLERN